MERKLFALNVISLVVLLMVPLDFIAGIFGPKKFERTSGAPDVFVESLSVCNTSATYKMTVENGEAGWHRVSSASIIVNGVEVASEKEFSQKVDRIERSVTLGAENSIAVKAASGPGGFIKVSIDCSSGCLGIKINSPASDAAINGSDTIVSGILVNAHSETGVGIKSISTNSEADGLGQVSGNNFAGLAALQTGANTIKTTATDVCGYQVQDAITINTESTDDPVRVSVNPSNGVIAPSGKLTVELEARANISSPVTSYSWDTNGDGAPDQEGADLSKATADYASAGIYFPAVTITDSNGKKYTKTTVLNILSKEELDALLKTKWAGMRGGLEAGNVEKALWYISKNSQKMYQYNFNLMLSVIDAETKEPLEGAVVVAVWERAYRTPTGTNSYFYAAKEVLTDKDGNFEIPSYISINLLPIISYIRGTGFTIFKPGYGSFPRYIVGQLKKRLSYVPYGNDKYGESNLTIEEFFLEEVGTEKEFWATEPLKQNERPQKIMVTFGIVELPRLKTREERRKGMWGLLPRVPDAKMPKLIELMNKERIDLGLEPTHLKGAVK